jgi:hypothetical protein
MVIEVQVQMSPGCSHGQRTVALVEDVVARLAPGARVEVVNVETVEDAERLGFRGSPTVLVNGVDLEAHRPAAVGLG